MSPSEYTPYMCGAGSDLDIMAWGTLSIRPIVSSSTRDSPFPPATCISIIPLTTMTTTYLAFCCVQYSKALLPRFSKLAPRLPHPLSWVWGVQFATVQHCSTSRCQWYICWSHETVHICDKVSLSVVVWQGHHRDWAGSAEKRKNVIKVKGTATKGG